MSAAQVFYTRRTITQCPVMLVVEPQQEATDFSPPILLSDPFEAEYCRALFIAVSLKVTASPFFTWMVADRKGKVLGFGAPPAKEIRDGGERCCSSASCRWRESRHRINTERGLQHRKYMLPCHIQHDLKLQLWAQDGHLEKKNCFLLFFFKCVSLQ